jgi:hypothetical protein
MLAVPIGLLMAWAHPPATSLAFHYSTLLIPILFLAALIGAGRRPVAAAEAPQGEPVQIAQGTAGASVLAACCLASVFFGDVPWSRPTLTEVPIITYGMDAEGNPADRGPGSAAHQLLDEISAAVRRRGLSVVATGRIAAHLLNAPRLETVSQLRQRWSLWETEAGPDATPIELFDWIVIDRRETLYQSPDDWQFVRNRAVQAGYGVLRDESDILLLSRPGMEW